MARSGKTSSRNRRSNRFPPHIRFNLSGKRREVRKMAGTWAASSPRRGNASLGEDSPHVWTFQVRFPARGSPSGFGITRLACRGNIACTRFSRAGHRPAVGARTVGSICSSARPDRGPSLAIGSPPQRWPSAREESSAGRPQSPPGGPRQGFRPVRSLARETTRGPLASQVVGHGCMIDDPYAPTPLVARSAIGYSYRAGLPALVSFVADRG